jgi:hypothetical protein
LPDALNSMFVDRAKEWPNSWEWQSTVAWALHRHHGGDGMLGPLHDCHGEVVSWEAAHEAMSTFGNFQTYKL